MGFIAWILLGLIAGAIAKLKANAPKATNTIFAKPRFLREADASVTSSAPRRG